MKEEYINMRNKSQYDIGWFHRYYKENGGNLDFNSFQLVFNLNDEILNELDRKFDLDVILDKNNQFVMVVE